MYAVIRAVGTIPAPPAFDQWLTLLPLTPCHAEGDSCGEFPGRSLMHSATVKTSPAGKILWAAIAIVGAFKNIF